MTSTPKHLRLLERRLGIELKEADPRYDLNNYFNQNAYQINQFGEIVGLNLYNNDLQDISVLQELKNLTSLDLSYNQLQDVSVLNKLKNLTSLDLSGNQIVDISVLKELHSLTSLDLSYIKLQDISALKELKSLTSLGLCGIGLQDLSVLQQLKNLSSLNLSHNARQDLSVLKELKTLTNLSLNRNALQDISVLKELKTLTTLSLSINALEDISVLKELKTLTSLYLDRNKLQNISVLKELKSLTTLSLSRNALQNISALKELKGLKSLELHANELQDISVLNELKSLMILDLSANALKDISVLKGLRNLTSLYLSNNQISDLGQFKDLFTLAHLIYIGADKNPCFTDNSIVLMQWENHYEIIKNEIEKRYPQVQEMKEGYLPEKIMLLGNHASGKSSLLHYLQKGNLNYSGDSTHILHIETYGKSKRALPKAIVYDFGGQDFYHGLYKAFFTVNATSLLLWNTATNKNEEGEDVNKVANRNYDVDYWMGQRGHFNHSATVLLLQTHADLPGTKRKSYLNDYEQIEQEFLLSLQKGNRDPLNEASLRYLQLHIDRLIERKRQENNPQGRISKAYYEFIQFLLAAEDTHIPIAKSELQAEYKVGGDDSGFESELEQLHRQGLVLVQGNHVWLKPTAVAQYVHQAVLKKEDVGKGILAKKDFEKRIDSRIQGLLLAQKIIFFDEGEQNYIIPNYLPLSSSDSKLNSLFSFDFVQPNFVLKFKSFIPFGLINQLICHYGQKPGHKYYWRDQLIFTTDDGKNKVLLQLDYTRLEIAVSISGKDKRERADDLEKELFRSILNLYYGKDADADSRLIKDFEGKLIDSFKSKTIEELDKAILSPNDLYLSVDNKYFIQHQSLEKTAETKIMAYPLDEQRQLCFDKAREQSCLPYKNFTNNKKIERMKKIFISYSRKDVAFKDALKMHLNMLHQFDIADNWSCEEITIGKWDSQIQKELQEADLIIYMLSANFFSSKYILEKEVQVGIERLDAEQKAKILCVVVSEFVGLDKLKEAVEHRSKTALQDAVLALAQHQYLPYDKVLNTVTNNEEEKIVSLKEHSNNNTIEKALVQITEKIIDALK